jgi:hypothetical protein
LILNFLPANRPDYSMTRTSILNFSAIIVKPAAIAFYATAVHNAANAVNEIVFGTAVLIRKKHIFL